MPCCINQATSPLSARSLTSCKSRTVSGSARGSVYWGCSCGMSPPRMSEGRPFGAELDRWVDTESRTSPVTAEPFPCRSKLSLPVLLALSWAEITKPIEPAAQFILGTIAASPKTFPVIRKPRFVRRSRKRPCPLAAATLNNPLEGVAK